MLRNGNGALLRWRRSPSLGRTRVRLQHQLHQQPHQHKRIYLIAGEASGDAIGAKVIRALERKRAHGDPRAQMIEFRGVGGPLMCAAGGFDSLFPMQELSVMGLVEVLPSLWRFRRKLQDTLADIRRCQPDVVLTIDSKGFTFRVLKALYADPATRDSITRMHYVAPSVWAYKHRAKKQENGKGFEELSRLLHAMFTILPFEEDIFEGRKNTDSEQQSEAAAERHWCYFVGHPAVEDFLEHHGQFDTEPATTAPVKADLLQDSTTSSVSISSGPDALLDFSKYSTQPLEKQGKLFQQLMESGRAKREREATRAKYGIPQHALVICALVGSRENEVTKAMQLVLEGIESFREAQSDPRQIVVVFPTIAAVESHVNAQLLLRVSRTALPDTLVLTDLSASERIELFKSADAAIAVSGTIVMETTLAALPTVVVYRANRVTELIALQLAAVRFVSIPNLLLGRDVIPELLFRQCTAANIDAALRKIQAESASPTASRELSMALSTLVTWGASTASNNSSKELTLKPLRASDAVANAILNAL